MAEFLCINGERIEEVWAQIALHINELSRISHGRLWAADIVEAVKHGKMQLWCAKESETQLSLMLTEILKHPRKTEVHIISATGKNADQWMPLWKDFERWAYGLGAEGVTATCRKGWKPLLEPIGFEERAIVLEKRL